MTLVKFNSDKSNQKGLVPAMGDVFDSIFTDSFFTSRNTSMVPAVNICEASDHFHIELAAPGLAKEDFKINLERNMLSISVEKEQQNNEEGKQFTRREFSYNSFVRSFSLPESADQNSIAAKYEDGVLKVNIPKKEEAKIQTRQITIS